ncbi:hypothetical protein [Variovorax sp. OV329]|uniref:hypothetical protein n=1 Tax=Variovorax sp. OV329 TaxID=1882825 RepID=UPI0011136DAC|nr:hypothetical protein [Variovorax sp. OV329]
MNPWPARFGVAVPMLAVTMAAHAGGHFEVDDAGTLNAGECQVELWGGHGRKTDINFYHAGPSCGVGVVELGLNWDITRGVRTNLLGPQAKWTFFGREPDSVVSAAVSAGAQYDVHHGGQWGGQGLLALSWQALAPLQVNANLGVDWATEGGDRYSRGGLQVQWAVRPDFTLIAERNHSFSQWGTRVGFSWQVSTQTSIDFSIAHLGLAGGEWVYTVGLNQAFDFGGKR